MNIFLNVVTTVRDAPSFSKKNEVQLPIVNILSTSLSVLMLDEIRKRTIEINRATYSQQYAFMKKLNCISI